MIGRLLRQPTTAAIGVVLISGLFAALATPLRAPPVEQLVAMAGTAALLALSDRFAVHEAGGVALTPSPVILAGTLLIFGWSSSLVIMMVAASPLLLRRQWRQATRTVAMRALTITFGAALYAAALVEPVFLAPLSLAAIIVLGYAAGVAVAALPGEAWNFSWPGETTLLRWYVPVMAISGTLAGTLWPVAPQALPVVLGLLGALQYIAHSRAALRATRTGLKQLQEQLHARSERLERLQSLATTMLATLDGRRQLQILCERLAALLDAEAGWVVLRDNDGTLSVLAAYRLPLTETGAPSIDQELYSGLLQRGQILLVADERGRKLAPSVDSDDPVRWSTVLAIPLATDHGALGAICLAFERLRGLDAADQRILTSFARQAAVAVENARLFTELRHKQAELIQSSKLAAVGTFAAGIGHEFNNLLGGMLGYAELGRSVDDVAEKDNALDVIRQACQRGRSVTRGLLTFARRNEHRRELCQLADAIDETLTLVEIDLRKLNITLVRAIEPTPAIVCDSGQIAQVILNLVTNARDAIGKGGGTITIALRQEGRFVELSVSDTGHGIPESIRDRIFEPFVTTKGALGSSSTPGTGLGLSVSYGIIKDHGGDIQIATAVGVGTTMTVRLPIDGP